MRSFRVILAVALLAAGALPSAPVAAARRNLCLTTPTTAAARAELAALAADNGGFELARAADPLCIRLLGPGRPTAALLAWAARHGVRLPTEDDGPGFSAGEAVVADSGHRALDAESAVALPAEDDHDRTDRFVRAEDEAPTSPRPAPLADRFACRAPPAA